MVVSSLVYVIARRGLERHEHLKGGLGYGVGVKRTCEVDEGWILVIPSPVDMAFRRVLGRCKSVRKRVGR